MTPKRTTSTRTKGKKGSRSNQRTARCCLMWAPAPNVSSAICRNGVYMGIDYRADHSFRIPRPDLSIKLGTPNACNRCHVDKTNQWSDQYITKWYGPGRRAHYGTIIDDGRKRSAEAHKDLIKLAADPLYPVIVRSTALSLLAAYPGERDQPGI